ncbi:helix-turn-helix domain-containing protein [Kitasatospora sp. NPDC094015]|uniref:helix-turn-helix domain-containing protein n=1 Tax=Kitasatospora sp. NPDC094015 TaxID=3155205 RepID=UPI003330A4D8
MTDQVGTLLRRLRSRAGLTQEQVAERSGVSVRTIRRLETGKSNDHRMGTLNLLANALEAGPEDRQRLMATLTNARNPADGDPVTGIPAQHSAPAPIAAFAPEQSAPPPEIAAPPPGPIRAALTAATEELAAEVRRRWKREEEQRGVHDPFPLPVRWQAAPAALTDHSENIQRLPPGATSPGVDLSGDLRSVTEVYRRISSGRLVVLGRAGSGKSVLTIRFVLDLLAAAAPADRVPVIFSLGSWDPTASTLRDWLIDRLLRDHPYLARRAPGGSTLASALVDADLVLPVLDGFDELAEGLRRPALEALNATSLPLVLTSRRGEFAEAVQAARAPLVWAAGIELTDLTPDDLAAYLPRTARPVTRAAGGGSGKEDGGTLWDAVLAELRARSGDRGPHLARALGTPLMVVLARTMYSEAPERDPAELLDAGRFPAEHAIEEHLLAGFVPAVYRRRIPERHAGPRRRPEPDPGPERAERWLGFLAHHLVRLDRERHDLAWWQLGDSLRRSTRILAVVLTTALCVAVTECLLASSSGPIGWGEILLQGVLTGPAAGLAFGAVYAAMTWSGGGSFPPVQVRLRLPGRHAGIGRRPVRAFAARFGSVLLGGFVLGVGVASAITLERGLYDRLELLNPAVLQGTLINMLVFGLIFGSGAGLVFGLLAALEAPLDVSSAATPSALLATDRATVCRQLLVLAPLLTVAIALGGRVVVVLLDGLLGPLTWPLADGLFVGAVGGIGGALAYTFSFTAWGQWVVVCRVWLPLTGRLPWDPVAFLDDAYRRGVLRQTGAVYQFRHVRLQHHLGRSFRERHARYAPARFARRP